MKEVKLWRGPVKKVTPSMKREMVMLSKAGISNSRIARKFGVSENAVLYHLNHKHRERVKRYHRVYRERVKPSSRYSEKYAEYMAARYHSDPEFRQRMLRHIKRYQQKIKTRNSRILIAVGTVLECPYCHRTWRIHCGHIRAQCPKCHRWLVKLPLPLKV